MRAPGRLDLLGAFTALQQLLQLDAAAGSAPANDTWTIVQGVDACPAAVPGHSELHSSTATLQECQAQCAANATCRVFTWNQALAPHNCFWCYDAVYSPLVGGCGDVWCSWPPSHLAAHQHPFADDRLRMCGWRHFHTRASSCCWPLRACLHCTRCSKTTTASPDACKEVRGRPPAAPAPLSRRPQIKCRDGRVHCQRRSTSALVFRWSRAPRM